MPEFLAKNGYKSPDDPANGVFQYAKGGYKGNLFEYYDAHPAEGASFNQVMGGVMATQASWLDIYPHDTLVADAAAHPDGPVLVDVGGNVGHDLERFRQAHPETASRLHLQDRADVVRLSKCPDPVNKTPYDFFTPQPVKGNNTPPPQVPISAVHRANSTPPQERAPTTCTACCTTGPTTWRRRSSRCSGPR